MRGARVRTLSIVLAVLGLAAATLLIGWSGAGRVAATVLSAGWGGFALLIAWQMLLFVVLGLAWAALVVSPPGQRRPHHGIGRSCASGLAGAADAPILAAPAGGAEPADAARWVASGALVMIWGRMVRDAAATCLPFSTLGGFLLGARAVGLHGVSWPLAAGSTVVDVTAELLAQIVFVAVGLAILLVRQPDTALAWPLAGGLLVAVAAAGGFVWVQHRAGALFAWLGRRIGATWFAGRREGLPETLAALYRRPGRLVAGFALHLLGWLGTGIGGFIAFRLLGARIDLPAALAIEALLHAVLALAFVVPGYAGVQEAAYAGLGAIFGVPAEIALGVSLLRRARDLAVGVPILLCWQGVELRRLRRA